MNGRTYNPTIGRFTSPDIFIQAPTNSQSFNRYIYVWNNPLKYTDPTGYETGSEDGENDTSGDGYDAGGASDAQAEENDNDENGHGSGGGGSSGGDFDSDNSDGYDPGAANDAQAEENYNDENGYETPDSGGWTSTDFIDDHGIGTVTYDQYGNNNVSYYADGSGYGVSGNIGYSHDGEGQYATVNYDTGAVTAGWNGGGYHQSATGIGEFHDTNIGYYSLLNNGSTLVSIVDHGVYDFYNKTLNTPIGRIGVKGAGSAVAAAKMGYKASGKLGSGRKQTAFAMGVLGLGIGLVVGAWGEYGFDIPLSKGQAAKQAFGIATE